MFDSIAPSPLKKSLKALIYISELYNSQFFCTSDQKRHNHAAPVSLSALFINPIFIPSLTMNTSDLSFSPSTQKPRNDVSKNPVAQYVSTCGCLLFEKCFSTG